MKEFLRHYFVPHVSNNHRAKILHHKSLVYIIAVFLCAEILLTNVRIIYPQVLGDSIAISIQELVSLTNQKRQENNLHSLTPNEKLSEAAKRKAQDMFAKDYWAHNSPDGATPWVFIEESGYTYTYAGENLARGFSNSSDAVNAWMKSQSHKENILSKNYDEVGFAVVEGELDGEQTVLIVQMFGNQKLPVLAKDVSPNQGQVADTFPAVSGESIRRSSFFESFAISKGVSLLVLFGFIVVFFLDMIIIERKKVYRFIGHSLDHSLFLSFLLVLVIAVKASAIL